MPLTDEPESPEDASVTQLLSGLMGGTADTRTVTRSGRCGKCGYMIGSPGHEITCNPG